MLTKVKVKDIRPNPFQCRQDTESEIESLAEEIKKTGLWAGALRGRENNGHVELCFGHRRLAALKLLGQKEVDVDVVPMSDEDMTIQSLAENLQRRGLNEVEKSEGVKKSLEILMKVPSSDNRTMAHGQSYRGEAIKKIQAMTGLSKQWLSDLLTIADFPEPAKKEIREGRIGRRASIEANHIGGAAAIKTFADKKVGQDAVIGIGKELRAIQDDEIKEKVRAKVIKGEVTTPEAVVAKARQLVGARKSKEWREQKPDLLDVMRSWTERAKTWSKQLDEVLQYLDYIDQEPRVAERWRAAVRDLIKRLEKFV